MSTAKPTTKPKTSGPSAALRIKQELVKLIPVTQFAENARKRREEYKYFNIEKNGGALAITNAEAYVTKRFQTGNRSKFYYMPVLQLAGTIDDIMKYISKIEVKDTLGNHYTGLSYYDLDRYFGWNVAGQEGVPSELGQGLSRDFIISRSVDPLEESGKNEIKKYKAEVEARKREHPGEKKGKFKYTIDEDLEMIRGLKRVEKESIVVDPKVLEETRTNARSKAVNDFNTLMKESLTTHKLSRYITLNNYNPVTMNKQQIVNKQPSITSDQSIVPVITVDNIPVTVPIYVGLKNEKDYYQRITAFYNYVNDIVASSDYYRFVRLILDSFNSQFHDKARIPLADVLINNKSTLESLYGEVVSNANMRENQNLQMHQVQQRQAEQISNLDLSHLPQNPMGARSPTGSGRQSPVSSVQSPIA